MKKTSPNDWFDMLQKKKNGQRCDHKGVNTQRINLSSYFHFEHQQANYT